MLDAASSRLLTTSDGGWFGQIKPMMLIALAKMTA
jgi:hypothetical protein